MLPSAVTGKTYYELEECMTHSQMLGKIESGGGPIFKVVLECLKMCSEPFPIYIYGIQCDFMAKSC